MRVEYPDAAPADPVRCSPLPWRSTEAGKGGCPPTADRLAASYAAMREYDARHAKKVAR